MGEIRVTPNIRVAPCQIPVFSPRLHDTTWKLRQSAATNDIAQLYVLRPMSHVIPGGAQNLGEAGYRLVLRVGWIQGLESKWGHGGNELRSGRAIEWGQTTSRFRASSVTDENYVHFASWFIMVRHSAEWMPADDQSSSHLARPP